MLKRCVSLCVVAYLWTTLSYAEEPVEDYGFLDPMDQQRVPWVPEESPEIEEPVEANIEADLSPYYREFDRDGKVTIFVGYGQGYYPGRGVQIFEMLRAMATRFGAPLLDWSRSPDGDSMSFRDGERNVTYSIKIGRGRNTYANAFSQYEIVMYHGHSRYGRGPSFGNYQNYFRMGRKARTLEVDTRNPYFRSEPIQKTGKYPIQTITRKGIEYPYQYRGQKDKKSHLSQFAYTKNIPGLDKDLKEARFLPGRQILYFYSCKNRQYWREAIRDRFPDPQHKIVFGTYKVGHGASKPEAVMIMSIVRRIASSGRIVKNLNATRDCDECFTSY